MKKYLSPLTFHLSSRRGFTLIELMIVLSIMSVLGTVGIAGFRAYSQTQVLQSAVNEFATALNTARSRALSQVKPASCGSAKTLDGYGIKVLADTGTPKYSYSMFFTCSGSDMSADKDKILPKDISFAGADNGKSFFFPTLTGQVQAPDQITVSGYGKDKIVSVNSLGGVSNEPLPTPLPTSTPTPTPMPGLIAWWKMNGNANDSSGNGNSGITTGATLIADKNGLPDKAYDFDAAGDYIATTNWSSFGSNLTGNFSIAFWLKTDQTASNRDIVGGQNGDGTVSTTAFIVNINGVSVGDVGLFLRDESGGERLRATTNDIDLNDGQWHHVAVVKSANNASGILIYKDGVSQATTNIIDEAFTNPVNFDKTVTIGARHNGTKHTDGEFANLLDGTLDDVRIYNRGLSGSEVNNLYTDGPQ